MAKRRTHAVEDNFIPLMEAGRSPKRLCVFPATDSHGQEEDYVVGRCNLTLSCSTSV